MGSRMDTSEDPLRNLARNVRNQTFTDYGRYCCYIVPKDSKADTAAIPSSISLTPVPYPCLDAVSAQLTQLVRLLWVHVTVHNRTSVEYVTG